MLLEFRIRRFALIDDVTLEFGARLNILTGETGSGKSVIITALSLLLGARPTGPVVRAGCADARLDAVFHHDDPEINRLLDDAGIEPEEDLSLTLSREFTDAGRSTARVNARAAPLSLLKALSERLVDLHGQYAHQALLRSGDHSQFLDAMGNAAHKTRLAEMSGLYTRLCHARGRLRDVRDNAGRIRDEADRLRFRIREIDALIAAPEEFPALEEDIYTLEHAQELATATRDAYALVGRDNAGALVRVATALAALNPVRGISQTLDAVITQLEDADAVLDTAARDLASLRDRFEHDPTRLEALRDRHFQIKDCMKKNNCRDIGDLFAFRVRSKERLEVISLDEDGIGKLETEAATLESEAARAAAALTRSRAQLSAEFGKKMQRELKELAMPGSIFEAALAPPEQGEPVTGASGDVLLLRAAGAERVEFRISANPGEPPRPLALTASGGELSRVMLALKSLLRAADTVPVLVFDEIDSGIGGETAHAIAHKLTALASAKQILCVTHLPQIAAAADLHFRVYKKTQANRTMIRAEAVAGEQRLREMTRMLGATGLQESEDLARKFIQQAEKLKSGR